ncbi:uncharacterized protein LOC120114654 [Hibiscus syriacus]|uniref:uncharacterized protein LOC120114654 n=1 Tax=Hibiscus syriacus TaxID=106335 RepID=UPI0019214A85|nr:uncharacterized protein LOC120114654 [Hibiscus syriacus]
MNIPSNLLNVAALKGVFSYHPKCKRIGLTHLCFADNLLIFCKGSINSVMGVQAVLDHFYSMSGLKLNASKCEMYVAGIPAEQSIVIKEIIGFNLGSLPFRYLGVPLVTRKLAVKIGSDVPAKGARVSWKIICLVKSEEGLGLQDVGRWNKSCIVQLIRNLLANEGSLWVAWMHSYVIRNADFWQMKIPTNASWRFKYLLKIRPDVAHLFSSQVCYLNARRVWDDLRATAPKVSWHHLVWFPGRIPKYNIIAWMTMLNRLPARARLVEMGLTIETDKCLLCGIVAETRDHLFFECSFAKEL